MSRRTVSTLLVLAIICTPLFVPLLTAQPGSQAAIAQAADNELTIVPTPLQPDHTIALTTGNTNAPIALQQLRLPASLATGVPFAIAASWTGQAREERWEIVYQLRADPTLIAAELISELDLSSTLQSTTLLPEEFWLDPQLAAGSYTLSLLIRDPSGARAPLTLAIEGLQADGSYALGSVAVEANATAARAAYSLYLPLIRAEGTASEPALGEVTTGTARGYLTTPQELAAIKVKADQGRAPYAANVRELLNHSSLSSPSAWVEQASISGTPYCSDGSQKDASGRTLARGPLYLTEGSKLIYPKMLYANLSSGSRAEDYARDSRARILDLVDTTNWGGPTYSTDNQCVLYLSWYITGFVMAADLLEPFPQIWTTSDKRTFQRWLATQIYPKVAWASRARTNNWGSGGSYAAAMIADYLWDSGLTLDEVAPKRLSLSPGQAYLEHTREQLSRMSTTIAERDKSASRCLPYKGIQSHGGIPDELRRAGISNPLSLCSAAYLPSISGDYDAAYTYQMTHVETLIGHAELALRRGDSSLYDNIAADGSGSILRAIKFIIQNPVQPNASYDWHVYRKAVLYIAYRYYRDPVLREHLYGDALRAGQVVIYGRLTHGFAADESPTPPPTVAAPAL